jgi:hypothetical protein
MTRSYRKLAHATNGPIEFHHKLFFKLTPTWALRGHLVSRPLCVSLGSAFLYQSSFFQLNSSSPSSHSWEWSDRKYCVGSLWIPLWLLTSMTILCPKCDPSESSMLRIFGSQMLFDTKNSQTATCLLETKETQWPAQPHTGSQWPARMQSLLHLRLRALLCHPLRQREARDKERSWLWNFAPMCVVFVVTPIHDCSGVLGILVWHWMEPLLTVDSQWSSHRGLLRHRLLCPQGTRFNRVVCNQNLHF